MTHENIGNTKDDFHPSMLAVVVDIQVLFPLQSA